MHNLQLYKSEMTKLCKIYKVRKLYAFGFILTESFNVNSDIDLIVEFENITLEDYADNYFDFKFSLQDILKRPVDLLEYQAKKNPYFRKTVDENRQLVYQSELSQEQIQRIEESKQQIKQDIFFTNEQADNLVDQWLNK